MKYTNSSELYHHGILGQRWGRRNGPPYPLDAEDHSAAERKAGKSGWSKEAKTETGRSTKSSSSTKNQNGNSSKAESKSLSSAERRRISKEYAKEAKAGDKNLAKNLEKMRADAYNKVAYEMDNGGIDKFDKAQEKKYGKNYADRHEYYDDFLDAVNNRMQEFMAESTLKFYETDTHYQKAEELVKKYDMTSWNDLAKDNAEGIEFARSILEKKT